MDKERPDPELLLREISAEARREERPAGRLKIFFGYAAGVGKTYAMLEAAHTAMRSGVEVVAGYIEPHTRPETLAMLEGLEQLPPLEVPYKNITLKEFDLDGAIARHPQLLLVDELAHTNAEGCRHQKRYQDVQELLRAGIDVYSTVNVQHLESINDIVAAITGVTVRERVPDSIFDAADQVELVDIEPEDLINRLNQGKIYRENQAKRALDHFFVPENLTSLREIALRRTADRVNRAKERTRKIGAKGTGFTEEHILICLSTSPSNGKVIRTAARMSEAFHGTFTALFVETPGFAEFTEEDRKRLRENLHLAEQLGAKIATVYGEDVPAQIAEYAKVSGISKIVIGRSNNKKRLLSRRQNLVERLTVLAPSLDIYIIPDNLAAFERKRSKLFEEVRFSLADTMKALTILAVCTAIGYLFLYFHFSVSNIITVYILGVLLISLVTRGRVYSGIMSIISVLVFNFCFTDPYFTFQFNDKGYWVTFFVMFISAFITSTLTMRVKDQAKQAARKSYRTEILLETSQKLQRAVAKSEIYDHVARQLQKLTERTVVFYPGDGGGLAEPMFYPQGPEVEPSHYLCADEQAVAQWVFRNNKHAGATTGTLPGARCLYMAVRNSDSAFAVVAIAMDAGSELDSFEKSLVIALLNEAALALEMEQIDSAKKLAEVTAQQEQLRANLLRAISHDLRTPLTSISGNAGILMGNSDVLTAEKKRQLYSDIYDDSMWLVNLVENLLSVTRIENGTMSIRMEPELLDEVINEALTHVASRSGEHPISVKLEDDLLMARMDSRLIVQVIINIVDNAFKYTPAGTSIEIRAVRDGDNIRVDIADAGGGIPDEAKAQLFEMFYTANNRSGDSRRGMGLGLSLCRSIVAAHGGEIWVGDNQPKGTVFSFTLKEVRANA